MRMARLRSHASLPFILCAAAALSACPAETPEQSTTASHVFLFIGDGMGLSSELVAARWLSGRDDGLAWQEFPFQAWASTWDTSSYDAHADSAGRARFGAGPEDPRLGYDPGLGGGEPWTPAATQDPLAYYLGASTDSAAAATAMATGQKTEAGNIAWERGDPVDGRLEGIAELLRARRGMAIGVLSTVPFNHATPAAFLAHASGRSDTAAIAEEIIGVARPEVLIGGGHPAASSAYFSQLALGELRASEAWSLVELDSAGDGGSALLAAAEALPAGRGLFGLFGSRSDGAFEAALPAGAPDAPALARGSRDPSLAAALRAALVVLARDPEGFFLMAEQGDIDWANHGRDAPRMIGAVASLDEAVREAISFIDRPGDGVDWGNSLLIVTADHATGLPRYAATDFMARGEAPIARAGSPGTWDWSGGSLSYATTGHGNELVTVAARGDRAAELLEPFVGAAAGYPGSRVMDNTGIFRAIAAFVGLP